MSTFKDQLNTSEHPVEYVNKTKEIQEYLSNQRLPDGVSKGIKIGESSSFVYVVPFLPYSPNKRPRIDLTHGYFPGVADWLAERNNGSGNGPYIAVFEHATRSKIVPLMVEKGSSVACVHDVKFTSDLTQIEMTFELDEIKL